MLGFSRSLRLQALWAAPRYSPVMWQWSRTESPSRGLSYTWHVSAARKASQSSRVILISFGSASAPLILLSSSCSDFKVLCCIGATIIDWWLRLATVPHHDVAIAASLMVLSSLGIALCGVELGPLNLSGEGLKIRINDERDRQLLVVVLKADVVLTLFRHLHPHGCLAYPTTVGSVGIQQILPYVAVQAALAELIALLVLALVTEKAVEVFDPCAVKFAGLFNQQQIYAGIPSGCVLSL